MEHDRAIEGCTRRGRPRLWAVLTALLCALSSACVPARSPIHACTLFPPGPGAPEPVYADLTAAVPFRSYTALTGVGPFAHHFAVSAADLRGWPGVIAVRYDTHGTLQLAPNGKVGAALRVPPPHVRGLARALEHELARRCPGVRFYTSYAGAFRKLYFTTFEATDVRAGSERVGRLSKGEILADAELEHTLSAGFRGLEVAMTSGLGFIRVPEGARWVEPDGYGAGSERPILAAARAREAGTPGPGLAELPVDRPDALLLDGRYARVHLLVHLGVRSASTSDRARLVLPLDVDDAVFGPAATGEASAVLATRRYTVQATLTPGQAFAAEGARVQRDYRGTLSVRILDPEGVAFERSYPTSGEVIVLGDEAAVAYAWMIPGGNVPSPEAELRRGHLRSAPGETIDFNLDTQLRVRPPH